MKIKKFKNKRLLPVSLSFILAVMIMPGFGITAFADTASIDAKDIVYSADKTDITSANAKNLSHLTAHSQTGYDITDTSSPTTLSVVIVNPDEINAINKAITDKKNGDFQLTFTLPAGIDTATAISDAAVVYMRDYTEGEPGTYTIGANDFTVGINIDDALFTPNFIVNTSNAVAVTTSGTAIVNSIINFDFNQYTEIKDHLKNGNTGTYPLTFIAPDGTEVKVNVTLTDKSEFIDDNKTLTANNFSYNIKDAVPMSDVQAKSNADLRLIDAFGNDDEQYYPNCIPDSVELADINKAISSGTTGTFPLTFKINGHNSISINVTLTNSATTTPTEPENPDNQDNPNNPDSPSTPAEPSNPGNSVITATIPTPPDFNSKDHFAYVDGYKDGTVHPNGSITRAEAATMIYRLLTDSRRDEIMTETNAFSDVSTTDWYNKPVSSMAKGGYITGYSNGKFGSDNGITRAEFVTILVRFTDSTSYGNAVYNDVPADHWAHDAISAASDFGWISGYSGALFQPDSQITRAEAIAILNRILYRSVDSKSSLSGIAAFSDNADISSWYYYEIIEASNAHSYESVRPNEIWTSLGLSYSYDKAKYE